jgi:hypothetical protein
MQLATLDQANLLCLLALARFASLLVWRGGGKPQEQQDAQCANHADNWPPLM